MQCAMKTKWMAFGGLFLMILIPCGYADTEVTINAEDDYVPQVLAEELGVESIPTLYMRVDDDAIHQLKPRLVLKIQKSIYPEREQTLVAELDGVVIQSERTGLPFFPVSTGRQNWKINEAGVRECVNIKTKKVGLEKAPSGRKYCTSTPSGVFQPDLLEEKHISKTWNAPMPWAVFFSGGVAVHATGESHYDELGTPASGGCVRMQYDDAKQIFMLVRQIGINHTLIFVQ